MLILNLPGLLQRQNPETIIICIFVQCFPHGNTVCIHMYDEFKRSEEIIVCHMPWYILGSIVQVCSLTIKYQVFQYERNTSISEQFVSILLTILQQVLLLLP